MVNDSTRGYSVYVTDENNTVQGSGVLFYAGGDTMFVFTCAHVVEGLEKVRLFILREIDASIDEYDAFVIEIPSSQIGVGPEMYTTLSLPYVQILTDSNKKTDESFPTLYNATLEEMNRTPFDGNCTPWEYGQAIGNGVHEKVPLLRTIYNADYIAVLTICLLINESRRAQP